VRNRPAGKARAVADRLPPHLGLYRPGQLGLEGGRIGSESAATLFSDPRLAALPRRRPLNECMLESGFIILGWSRGENLGHKVSLVQVGFGGLSRTMVSNEARLNTHLPLLSVESNHLLKEITASSVHGLSNA
jgi:hypothetical protein